MPSKIQPYEVTNLALGVNVHTPDLSTDLELTMATLNVTSGIYEGIGPRFGTAPIPGHADAEPVPAGKYPGLMASETAQWGSSAFARQKVYGVFPISLGGANQAITKKGTYYAVLVGYTDSSIPGSLYLDLLILSTNTTILSTPVAQQSQMITDGLHAPLVRVLNYNYTIFPSNYAFADQVGMLEFVPKNNTAQVQLGIDDIRAVLRIDPSTNYVSSASFSVNSGIVPCPWLAGMVQLPPTSATQAPSITLSQAYPPQFGIARPLFGIIPEIVYGNFKPSQRDAIVYGLQNNGDQNVDYAVKFKADQTVFQPTYDNLEQPVANINLNAITATKISSGTNYSYTAMALYHDEQMCMNPAYQGVLVASQKALCFIVQDWLRSVAGTMPQLIDLANFTLKPKIYGNSPTPYMENGQATLSCFYAWPAFVSGTAMVTSAYGVGLGAANTGLLRANTVYEFTYSLFNKRLNTESNVGVPVKFQTGTTDFVALQLFNSSGTIKTPYAAGSGSALFAPCATGDATFTLDNSFPLNHLEYRFYYRQLGFQEWLPALFIDAVKYWFYPYHNKLYACAGGIGGLIGGRPGGFQDYSTIPPDNYTCVVTYKNRAFWFSDKALVFSLQDNIFAYPTGNSATVPNGTIKGALVQAYYGQAEQDARLVIFTTGGTYVGKFSGVQEQAPVQVSPTTVANFALDGSDFQINAWTSVSAFSYRSAVVAEGVLYFWGPNGIYQDDGVQPVMAGRISLPLEPDLFNLYDPSATDAICCAYNDTTKEVTWFYKPKVADAYPTHALTWNRVRQTWTPQAFAGQVDGVQPLNVASPIPTAGKRQLIFTRDTGAATVQRAQFFDYNNRSGDVFPTRELMVKSFTTPSPGVRRLKLAAGYSPARLSTIALNDILCLQQLRAYATSLVTGQDFLGTAGIIDTVNGTIDVNLPTGVTMDASATLATNDLFFPLYHQAKAGNGINGFPFALDVGYWCPGGMAYWAHWLHMHMMFKMQNVLPAAAPLSLSLTYRSPISDAGSLVDTLVLTNNSDQNCQILKSLRVGDQNIEGQGLRFTVGGIQLGAAWMLQYLCAYAQEMDGHQLSIFEE